MAVIDANVLRNKREIERRIERFHRTGESIVLPQSALFEMTKHPEHWKQTVTRSLEVISASPGAVEVSAATKSLGLVEERTGIPCKSVHDRIGSTALQQILREYGLGGASAWAGLMDAIRAHREELRHDEHVSDSLTTMTSLAAMVEGSMDRSTRARIARDLAERSRTSFRKFCGDSLVLVGYREAAVRRGVDPVIADKLTAEPTISVMHAPAMGVIAFQWAILGGIEAAHGERVANDVLDVEYALAGIWSGGLVTDDGGAESLRRSSIDWRDDLAERKGLVRLREMRPNRVHRVAGSIRPHGCALVGGSSLRSRPRVQRASALASGPRGPVRVLSSALCGPRVTGPHLFPSAPE